MGCQIPIDASHSFQGEALIPAINSQQASPLGIKCCVLADARNSFVSRFCVYTGRDANTVADIPMSKTVVLQLLEDYENSHHHLYVDNFYTSPALFT